MALCCLLAFWTGNGRTQLDRLFRRSGLMRQKWDEVHYADGATYGEKNVQRAIDRTSDVYDPEPESDSDASGEPIVTAQPSADMATTPLGTTRQLGELLEQHRTLEKRVEELETVIEEQANRIAVLETQLRETEAGTARDRSSPPPAPSDTASTPHSETTNLEHEGSLLDRATDFVSRDPE